MDNKLTDNEIVNDVEQVTMALEYCVECDCEKCPYDELTACNEYLKLDAVKVINRLQAENKRLKGIKTTDWLVKGIPKEQLVKEQIQALKGEIEYLEAENERLQATIDSFTDIGKLYSEIKAEAYKEFVERLIEKLKISELQLCEINERTVTLMLNINEIKIYSDNLLKELVGDKK